jgi:arsenate reductase
MKRIPLFSPLEKMISTLDTSLISEDRKHVLSLLISYIQEKVTHDEPVNINFICTHNSRRSHFAQIWTQSLGHHFGIPNIHCYSGGTETTALALGVLNILKDQGFEINTISAGKNPIHAIKYSHNSHPILGFSKKYDDSFNPESNFAAIMTCSQADGGCPFIPGAEKRIPITYEDPKLFDGTDLETRKYKERSIQIATEMLYVFRHITQ